MDSSLSENILSIHSSRRLKVKGMGMVILGAVMWGVSGTAAQVLFQKYGFTPGWLVTVRMVASGVLLLIAACIGSSFTDIMTIWRSYFDAIKLVIYSILGLVGVQYTYFASINKGNAATATLLQYLGPIFIVVYVALRSRKLPTPWECLAVFLAMLGTFLLITDGNLNALSVSGGSVVWGVLSAGALAFYTLYPGGLIAKYGSAAVVGWAMLIGGVGMSILAPPWHSTGHNSWESWALIAFVVIFGTLIAFYLYLSSLRYISPSTTSLLACTEPLSAVVVSVLVLHVKIGPFATFGGTLIIATIFMLSKRNS